MKVFEMLKLFVVVYMHISFFGSCQRLLAQPVSSSPCFTRLLQGSCATDSTGAIDRTTCCSAISNEIATDLQCMCTAFNADLTTARTLLQTCGINTGILTSCQDSSSTPADSDTPSNDSTPTDSPTSGGKTKIIIGVVVAIVIVVVVIIIIVTIVLCTRKSKPKLNNVANYSQTANGAVKEEVVPVDHTVDIPPQSPVTPAPVTTKVAPSSPVTLKDDLVTSDSLHYELATLRAATNNFSVDNQIGRGGFRLVYKGTLHDGREIAVKRLSPGSSQGDKEFKTELEFLAKLQHRNLVRLLGFCLADDEALLVYEFVENKSLDYFLFDPEKRKELNWSCRFEIIKGIAKGMLYLHEDSPMRIIHRDLKAANVLLDGQMNAKIADFGLARFCDLDQTHIATRRVVGTQGYMAPEYLHQGQFSVKSDVYALGVIILEIVSCKRILSSIYQPGGPSENLLSYAWRCWEDENPLKIIDPTLKDSFSSDEVIKCVQLALLCVQEEISKRPKMSTLVHMLNSYSAVAALSVPQHPASLYNSSSDQSTVSTTVKNSTFSSGVASSSAVSSLSWSDFKPIRGT